MGYYQANVAKSLDFAAHLLRNGCGRLIFSSSAAIYRASADLTVYEDSPIDPQSPHAHTKAVCEAMFADIAAAQPIRVLSLQYFNPIGADPMTSATPSARSAAPARCALVWLKSGSRRCARCSCRCRGLRPSAVSRCGILNC